MRFIVKTYKRGLPKLKVPKIRPYPATIKILWPEALALYQVIPTHEERWLPSDYVTTANQISGETKYNSPIANLKLLNGFKYENRQDERIKAWFRLKFTLYDDVFKRTKLNLKPNKQNLNPPLIITSDGSTVPAFRFPTNQRQTNVEERK